MHHEVLKMEDIDRRICFCFNTPALNRSGDPFYYLEAPWHPIKSLSTDQKLAQ
jgi:hypothetical protein